MVTLYVQVVNYKSSSWRMAKSTAESIIYLILESYWMVILVLLSFEKDFPMLMAFAWVCAETILWVTDEGC